MINRRKASEPNQSNLGPRQEAIAGKNPFETRQKGTLAFQGGARVSVEIQAEGPWINISLPGVDRPAAQLMFVQVTSSLNKSGTPLYGEYQLMPRQGGPIIQIPNLEPAAGSHLLQELQRLYRFTFDGNEAPTPRVTPPTLEKIGAVASVHEPSPLTPGEAHDVSGWTTDAKRNLFGALLGQRVILTHVDPMDRENVKTSEGILEGLGPNPHFPVLTFSGQPYGVHAHAVKTVKI